MYVPDTYKLASIYSLSYPSAIAHTRMHVQTQVKLFSLLAVIMRPVPIKTKVETRRWNNNDNNNNNNSKKIYGL